MQRLFSKRLAVFVLLGWSLIAVGYSQSLGDVARKNRAKKAKESAEAPKVITNNDLPKDPEASEPEAGQAATDASASKSAAAPKPVDKRAVHRSAQQSLQRRLAEQRTADRWRNEILEQKNRIATLQARADQLNASIRADYGTVQYEAPYSRSQARRLERVAQVQEQIEEQKGKLADMQEAARRAGMHTAVYDP